MSNSKLKSEDVLVSLTHREPYSVLFQALLVQNITSASHQYKQNRHLAN
jgi:hypothetical protein